MDQVINIFTHARKTATAHAARTKHLHKVIAFVPPARKLELMDKFLLGYIKRMRSVAQGLELLYTIVQVYAVIHRCKISDLLRECVTESDRCYRRIYRLQRWFKHRVMEQNTSMEKRGCGNCEIDKVFEGVVDSLGKELKQICVGDGVDVEMDLRN